MILPGTLLPTQWSARVSLREGRTLARVTVVDLSSATSLLRPGWIKLVWNYIWQHLLIAWTGILETFTSCRQLIVPDCIFYKKGAAWNCELGHWLCQGWIPRSLHRGCFTDQQINIDSFTNCYKDKEGIHWFYFQTVRYSTNSSNIFARRFPTLLNGSQKLWPPTNSMCISHLRNK